jgi:Growth-Arrest-Specific Protein 2 Domain
MSHPQARQDVVFTSRANALAKRLSQRADSASVTNTILRPVHLLLPDYGASNADIIETLSSELVSSHDLAKKVEILAKEYHASYEAVHTVESLCSVTEEHLINLNSLVRRLENGVEARDGDGTPPNLDNIACLVPTSHAAFLALFPSLMDEMAALDARVDTTTRSFAVALLRLNQPNIDTEFKARATSIAGELSSRRTASHTIRDDVAIRVNQLRQVRRVRSSLDKAAEVLEELHQDINDGIKRDKWTPHCTHVSAPLTPESSMELLPDASTKPADALQMLEHLQITEIDIISSSFTSFASTLPVNLRDYMTQDLFELRATIDGLKKTALLWEAIRVQTTTMASIMDETNDLRVRLEDLKSGFEDCISDILDINYSEEGIVSVQERLVAEEKELREVSQATIDGLSGRVPFVSDNTQIFRSFSAHNRRASSLSGKAVSIRNLRLQYQTDPPVDTVSLDNDVRVDCNQLCMMLSGAMQSVQAKAHNLDLAHISKAAETHLHALNDHITRIASDISTQQTSFHAQEHKDVEQLAVMAEDLNHRFAVSHADVNRSLSRVRELIAQMESMSNNHDTGVYEKMILPRVRAMKESETRFNVLEEQVSRFKDAIAELQRAVQERLAEIARLEDERRKKEKREEEERERREEQMMIEMEEKKRAEQELRRREEEQQERARKDAEERERVESERREREEKERTEREARERTEGVVRERTEREEKERTERETRERTEREEKERTEREARERAEREEKERREWEERERKEREEMDRKQQEEERRKEQEDTLRKKIEREQKDVEERKKKDEKRKEDESKERGAMASKPISTMSDENKNSSEGRHISIYLLETSSPSSCIDVFGFRLAPAAEISIKSNEMADLQSQIFHLRKRLRSLNIGEFVRPASSAGPLPNTEVRDRIVSEFSTITRRVHELPSSVSDSSVDTELKSLRAELSATSNMLNTLHKLVDFSHQVGLCDASLSDLLEHIDSYPSLPMGPLTSLHVSDRTLRPSEQISARLTFTQSSVHDVRDLATSLSNDPRVVGERDRVMQTWCELEAMAKELSSSQKSRPASSMSSSRSSSRSSGVPLNTARRGHRKAESYARLSTARMSTDGLLLPPSKNIRRTASGSIEPRGQSISGASVSSQASSTRSVSGPNPGPSRPPSRLYSSTFSSRQRTTSLSSNLSTDTASPTSMLFRSRVQTGHFGHRASPSPSEVSSLSRSMMSTSTGPTWSRPLRQSLSSSTRPATPRRQKSKQPKKPYVPNPGNKLDVAVGDVVNKLPININVEVVADTWKDRSGKYWIGDQDPKLCFCRILRSQTVMVRVGGGWQELSK